MKPRIGILDPRFVYRNSASTDVRETFNRVRAAAVAQAQRDALVAKQIESALVIVAHVKARTLEFLP
jgi:hypothetical protein